MTIFIQQFLTIGVLFFFLMNLINVILATSKTILTVKGGRLIATIINALTYGFYAVVVKQITTYNIEIVVAVTVIANVIGVYTAKTVLDKIKKDVLWKITVILESGYIEDFRTELVNAGLGFNEYVIETKKGNTKGFDVFVENQKRTAELKRIIEKYEKVKYHILEIGRQL